MKKHIKRTVLCSLLTGITILGLAACSTTSKDERSAGRALDDENVAEEVRQSLDQEPVYKFESVEVKAFAGEVQLSGFVNTEEQKRRAGEVASRVSGVVNVHNNLVLKPMALTPTGRTNAVHQPTIYSTQPQDPNAPQRTAPDQSTTPK